MGDWEYNPIPRYFLCERGNVLAEVIRDKQGPTLHNDWDEDGEEWRAIHAGDGLIGRYASCDEAMRAAEDNRKHRSGLKLVGKTERIT
jgi:hypothetical protein